MRNDAGRNRFRASPIVIRKTEDNTLAHRRVGQQRAFDGFRAYYEFVPKGKWALEYTLRLNQDGAFNLPPTRVEAMYAPEMFGELPNSPVRVR